MNQKNGHPFDFSGICPESYYYMARCCHEYLSKLKPETVKYSTMEWNEDEINNENQDLFERLPVKDSGVVYAISLRDGQGNGVWEKRYIGTSKEPRKRIKQHLVACAQDTRSCLERVQEVVRCGRDIGISWVKIEPPFLRVGVEHMIIGLEKVKNENALPWNELPGERPGRGSTSRSSD